MAQEALWAEFFSGDYTVHWKARSETNYEPAGQIHMQFSVNSVDCLAVAITTPWGPRLGLDRAFYHLRTCSGNHGPQPHPNNWTGHIGWGGNVIQDVLDQGVMEGSETSGIWFRIGSFEDPRAEGLQPATVQFKGASYEHGKDATDLHFVSTRGRIRPCTLYPWEGECVHP